MGKVLEGANIKFTSVASKMDTVSGMNMIRALIDGIVDPAVQASMTKGRMRSKTADLKRALNGLVAPHQQMMLKAMLGHIDQLSISISELDTEIEKRMSQDVELIEALDEITDVGKISAQTILAEIGTDMSRFSTADHLASWACMCPGNNESLERRRAAKPGRPIPRLIQNGTHYRDLGTDFFQKRNKEALVKQNVKRLQALGFKVILERIA